MNYMQERIDCYATHATGDIRYRRGRPLPFGATIVPNGVNFSVFSSAARTCSLVLFRRREREPFVEIQIPDDFRIGDAYSILVFDLDCENLEYGYRFSGPFDVPSGHRFDGRQILCDPYARAMGGRDVWRAEPDWDNAYQHRARLSFDDFDWQGDVPPGIPTKDLVIYEMHVRGFTADPSSGVSAPGTFAGLRERIPYLKALGVNCLEFMPICEFDEWEYHRLQAEAPVPRLNYWGYSPTGFFAPKAGYAATGSLGMQADEFKELVRVLHGEGIEIILDVVFNHTAEGDERGPYISFRGIDNRTYYMLSPDGYYMNFSGCGNTFNCNHPVVRNMVLDCLRHWVAEYHVDGFRFDLASILGRAPSGAPLANPPLLESLAYDPILSRCKLIAEAWDAGGLYQVGSFPAYGRWAEWNGKYRDAMRRFLKGDEGMVGEVAARIQGSPDLYGNRTPTASVNFVTCHDGFTLWDVVSYNDKHNEANGESNNDGTDQNYSWNCGCEGETDRADVNLLRQRQVRNAATFLFLSRGVPMMLMGDEVGRTQMGNNNAYCHDSPLSWMPWDLVVAQRNLFRFFRKLIAFRRAHPVLRSDRFFVHEDYAGSGNPDISFHGTRVGLPDFGPESRSLAYRLCGRHASPEDQDIYVAMNMYWEDLLFEVPSPVIGRNWRAAINTAMASPRDIFDPDSYPVVDTPEIRVVGRSITVLVC